MMVDQKKSERCYGSIGVTLPAEENRLIASKSVADSGRTDDQAVQFVRACLEDGIVEAWRAHILRRLKEQGVDLPEIAIRLGRDAGNLSRWRSKENKPHTDTLLLAVAAFDTRLNGHWPRGREAVIDGMIHCLHQIRADIVKREPALLDRSILACLHYTTLSIEWSLAEALEGPLRARKKDLAAAIVCERVFRFAGYRIRMSAAEIETLLRNWELEWLIFHSYPPYVWEFPADTIGRDKS